MTSVIEAICRLMNSTTYSIISIELETYLRKLNGVVQLINFYQCWTNAQPFYVCCSVQDGAERLRGCYRFRQPSMPGGNPRRQCEQR